jgi:uncharacterized membrane-anchored protein
MRTAARDGEARLRTGWPSGPNAPATCCAPASMSPGRRRTSQLLESMDKTRGSAAAASRRTVEGLSVVAISYYAVNLATYLLAAPAKTLLGLDTAALTAALVLPVVALVWLAIRQIRRSIE